MRDLIEFFDPPVEIGWNVQPTPAAGHTASLESVMQEVVDVEVAPGVFQPVPMAVVAGAIKAHFKKIMAAKRGGGGTV